MGFRIFLHSVRLVFGQFPGALRISGVLYLISVVLTAIVLLLPPANTADQASVAQFVLSGLMLAVVALSASVIYLWIAVSWHRFVLLDEVPAGRLPLFRRDRMLAYFGRGVQVALIGIAIGLVLSVVLGTLMAVSNGSQIVAILAMLVVVVIILLISYRLAPIFPSTAIGQSLGVKAAWAATSGASGTIIVLAIVSGIAGVAIDLPAQLLHMLPGGIWLGFIWLCITGWVKLMVGVSILTTLYGVYIEKRTIA